MQQARIISLSVWIVVAYTTRIANAIIEPTNKDATSSYPCQQTWISLADCLTKAGLSLKQTNALASSLSAQSFRGFFPSLELLSRLCQVRNPRQPLICLGMILSTTKCRKMAKFLKYVDLDGLSEAMRGICPNIGHVLAISQPCLPKARSDLRLCVRDTYLRASLPERVALRPPQALVCKNYLSIHLCIKTAYSECPKETQSILLTQVRYTQPNYCKLIYWDSGSILDTCTMTLEAVGKCLKKMNSTLSDGMTKNAYNPDGIKTFMESEICPKLFRNTNLCLNKTINGSPCQWVQDHSDQYYHDVEHLKLHLCSKESVECASSRAAFSRCYWESGILVDSSSWSMGIAGMDLVLKHPNICRRNYERIRSCLTGAGTLSRCRQSRDQAKLSVLEGGAEALRYFCKQEVSLKTDALACFTHHLAEFNTCKINYQRYLTLHYGTRNILVELCQIYMEDKFCMNQFVGRACPLDERRLLWKLVDTQQPEQCELLELVIEDSKTSTGYPLPRKDCLAIVEWYAFCQGLGGGRKLRHDTLINMADPVAMATMDILDSIAMEICDESRQLTETLPCLRRTVDNPEPYCVPLDNMNFVTLEKTGRALCQNFDYLKTQSECLNRNLHIFLSCCQSLHKLCSPVAIATNCIATSYADCGTSTVAMLREVVMATTDNFTDNCERGRFLLSQSQGETSLAELVGHLGLFWDLITSYFSAERSDQVYG